ncbi:solute carrier organic anion transporter family member 1A6 [Microplitis demolitor]|uniref:solute carrier organic anion transporter family member 1A6 n=1 Tax=Microplitis demolitor TaxID=69319 RepID=UPI0004CCA4B1|nr:solute carrier organic anion transporter family member 1A6 [Microplitis demolitor]
MVLGTREIMRSDEMEGELSGPAHPIPNESLDCGCAQLPCPKLAKYATRKFYVGILCWIGIIQAAGQAYFSLTSSTIARRFNFPSNSIEWMTLFTEGVVPFILALPIAYWGDRIHRAAWTGALVLIQSVGFFFIIIPHFSHSSPRVVEETTNVTHLSLYSEDNPELCSVPGLARVLVEEEGTCYFTLTVVIISQIINCMGNIAYLALGISYLDDNTRKRHVAIPIGFLLAVKIIGMLLGYLMAWGCLRIDADDLTVTIQSYREQFGAWWLGWPILMILLVIPALALALLPRRLPSEVVEQAAASILDIAGRTSPLTESTVSDETKKFGDTGFFSSLKRLLTNKIFLCNTFSSIFSICAIVNFAYNEDLFLESRFYVPRPSGIFLGFSDPFTSRIVAIIFRPIIIGSVIIASGFIIAKVRPRAKWLVSYNTVIAILAATIIFSLAFIDCKKPPIFGSKSYGSFSLLEYCNRNCRCSKDANFRPICDTKNVAIFFTPCHAGCTGIDTTSEPKKFTGCSCVKKLPESSNSPEVIEGLCDSTTCQIGWIIFEVSTILAYTLLSSGAISSFLISLRSVFIQDKALAIGFWITLTTFITYIPGKMFYWQITDWTCIHRGNSQSCHLHNTNLGSYLSYTTTFLLLLAIIFQVLTFFFCKKLRIYREIEFESRDAAENSSQIRSIPLETLSNPDDSSFVPNVSSSAVTSSSAVATGAGVSGQSSHATNNSSDIIEITDSGVIRKVNGPLKYGPVGPGDSDQNNDTDEHDQSLEFHNKRAPISLTTVSYRRLKLDSDNETSDSSGSVKNFHAHKSIVEISSKTEDTKVKQIPVLAGFSRTDDIKFVRIEDKRKTGDFNEVGIPIVEYPLTSVNSRSIGSILTSPEMTEHARRFRSKNYPRRRKAEPGSDGLRNRPLSPQHTSSGFESSASDLHNDPNISDVRQFSKSTSNLGQPARKPKLHGFATAL